MKLYARLQRFWYRFNYRSMPDLIMYGKYERTLQWRHNGRDCVSNQQPRDCLVKRLFRLRSKKTSKLRVTGLCAGNSPGPVNSPHKWPVTRKMFPFDDVIMNTNGVFQTVMWQANDPTWLVSYTLDTKSCHDAKFFKLSLCEHSWVS